MNALAIQADTVKHSSKAPVGKEGSVEHLHQVLQEMAVTLKLYGRWLVCADICIPESASLELVLPVSTSQAVEDPVTGGILEAAINALPRSMPGISSAHLIDNRLIIDVHFTGLQAADIEQLDFLPYTENLIDLSVPVKVTYTDLGARLEMVLQDHMDMSDLSGLILYTERIRGERLQSAFAVRPWSEMRSCRTKWLRALRSMIRRLQPWRIYKSGVTRSSRIERCDTPSPAAARHSPVCFRFLDRRAWDIAK